MIKVQFNEPKKYKIPFSFILNIDEDNNVYDLLTTKAILLEMTYKDRVIYR